MVDRAEWEALYRPVVELQRQLNELIPAETQPLDDREAGGSTISDDDAERISALIQEMHQRLEIFHEFVRSQEGGGPDASG